MQLGRPAEALDFYDRAMKVASSVPELHYPLMTLRGPLPNALITLDRAEDADDNLN